jgi:hypothetical protein
MLDCEPSDIEEPSDDNNGGVSPPELDLRVIDQEQEAGPGRENTGIASCTRKAYRYYIQSLRKEPLTRRRQILSIRHKATVFQALPFQKPSLRLDHPFSAKLF